MAVLVGFTGTHGGQDGLAFGALLARSLGTHLDVAMILPAESFNSPLAPEQSYEELVREQAREWLEDAEEDIRGVDIQTHLRRAESPAEGMIAACEELKSQVLVIGAGRHGALGKVSLGSVGQTLMHSAGVPLGLAPRGSRHQRIRKLSRITVGIGSGKSTPALIKVASQFAAAGDLEVRMVSVQERADRSVDDQHLRESGMEIAQEAVKQIQQKLPENIKVTPAVAIGDDISDSAEDLEWRTDEMALLGSSRLAAPQRLFLGPVANKVLRVLPVPLIVVPREYGQDETGGAGGTEGEQP